MSEEEIAKRLEQMEKRLEQVQANTNTKRQFILIVVASFVAGVTMDFLFALILNFF